MCVCVCVCVCVEEKYAKNYLRDVLLIYYVVFPSVTLWVASVSVGVGARQRIPLSALARNPHKGLAREISHETGRRQGKEGPSGQDRTVSRREQQRPIGMREQSREEGHSQQKGAEETSRQNRSVRR